MITSNSIVLVNKSVFVLIVNDKLCIPDISGIYSNSNLGNACKLYSNSSPCLYNILLYDITPSPLSAIKDTSILSRMQFSWFTIDKLHLIGFPWMAPLFISIFSNMEQSVDVSSLHDIINIILINKIIRGLIKQNIIMFFQR